LELESLTGPPDDAQPARPIGRRIGRASHFREVDWQRARVRGSVAPTSVTLRRRADGAPGRM